MKWFFYVLAVLFLTLLWSVLNQAFSIGTLLMGLTMALMVSLGLARLIPRTIQIKRLWPLVCLFFIVSFDVVVSNLALFKIIWKGKNSRHIPDFIHIPLEITHPHALAALACIVTYTPGTVLAHISAEDGMTLHVIDRESQSDWEELIKQRYERRLKEIFE